MSRTLVGAARGVAFAVAIAGCRGKASSPEAAVRALDEAARAGDVSSVMEHLGPSTRARLDAAARTAGEQAGRRRIAPTELLAAGWAPPAWELDSLAVVARHGDQATVEARGAHGETERIETVRERGREWKVELP